MECNLDRIEDILFEGTAQDIKSLRCECGGEVSYLLGHRFYYGCKKCGNITSLSTKNLEVPNCVKYFGDTNCEDFFN